MSDMSDSMSDTCPHACGDEPDVASGALDKDTPVPTHVGMNLSSAKSYWRATTCPHACGDEPVQRQVILARHHLSPRMWG